LLREEKHICMVLLDYFINLHINRVRLIYTHTRRIYDKNLTIGRDIYMCVGQVHVGLSFAGGLRGADRRSYQSEEMGSANMHAQ
jgi:hypothetical protein